MASFDQEGNAEPNPVFPFSLRLVPNHDLDQPATVAEGYTDFREQLKAIPQGSWLYDVYAMDQPVELGGTESYIARIWTKSELTTSYWGDDHMYFRHERMDDDLKLRPEWEKYTPKYHFFQNLEQEELCNLQ